MSTEEIAKLIFKALYQQQDVASSEEVNKGERRFLTMERADDNESGMASVSPFTLKKICDEIGIDTKNISLLRNQTILIETKTREQMDKVLAIEAVGKVPVKVSHHPKLNLSRGVVKNCHNLCHCDIRELLEEAKMKEQKVMGLRQIKRHLSDEEEAKCYKENVKPARKDTGIFIVTFDTPDLPSNLDVGFRVVPVELYIPKPLRCFKCQRLGHAQVTCKNATAPVQEAQQKPSGKNKKGGKNKKQPLRCLNCSGNHESWSKTCPKYENERKILYLKAVNGVNYVTAKKMLKALEEGAKNASAREQASKSDSQGLHNGKAAAVPKKMKGKAAGQQKF